VRARLRGGRDLHFGRLLVRGGASAVRLGLREHGDRSGELRRLRKGLSLGRFVLGRQLLVRSGASAVWLGLREHGD
jgi:hypothetical protein